MCTARCTQSLRTLPRVIRHSPHVSGKVRAHHCPKACSWALLQSILGNSGPQAQVKEAQQNKGQRDVGQRDVIPRPRGGVEGRWSESVMVQVPCPIMTTQEPMQGERPLDTSCTLRTVLSHPILARSVGGMPACWSLAEGARREGRCQRAEALPRAQCTGHGLWGLRVGLGRWTWPLETRPTMSHSPAGVAQPGPEARNKVLAAGSTPVQPGTWGPSSPTSHPGNLTVNPCPFGPHCGGDRGVLAPFRREGAAGWSSAPWGKGVSREGRSSIRACWAHPQRRALWTRPEGQSVATSGLGQCLAHPQREHTHTHTQTQHPSLQSPH